MTAKSRLRAFASVSSLVPFLGLAGSGHAVTAPHGDDAACRAMLGVTIAPHTVITKADDVTDSAMVGATKAEGPFCRIGGVATPTADSHIGFEVWLPPAAQWNGVFQAEGSGGSAGSLSPAPMLAALKRGFATMSTDNGHLNDPKDPTGGSGQGWAYRHPEKMIDWGWRALHMSTVAAKNVIRRYYGKPAAKNYFVACSAGGHHALMEASRFPADYDGMVAGAAPWQWSRQMLGETWNSIPALKDKSAITADSVRILHKAMVAACDKLDGLEDGIIADPRRCTVDPAAFQCSASRSSECLTPVQAAAARWIYAGVTRADGTQLYPGHVRGSELGWTGVLIGPAPGGSSWEFWSKTVLQEPDFRNADFNVERDFDRALAAKFSGESLEEVYDSRADLTAFKARGGKFVLFQGWADANITPKVDVAYYEGMIAKYGEAATDSFLRFFLLPGMGHCSGGEGFSHIGGATGAPVADDADHDMVRAMELWVEKGKAPDRFIAAHIDQNKAITATRPVCRYPLEAHYKGSGDAGNAANFVCAVPKDRP